MIKVEQVHKSYNGEAVLRDVNFSVKRGECFGIIGPNGSGKSTLLKLLSAAEWADTGRIELEGKDITGYSRKQLARLIAVLQQEPMPPVGFNVREVVEMGRFPFQNWLGEETQDTEVLIDSILEKLGLSKLAHRTLEYLSGGERQRVALGKTMAQQPRLLILDEPTTYLDIGHQILLMDRIREWQREAGMTVIAVLHDLNLASLYCDRILVLDKGKVVDVGTPRQVLRSELIRYVYGITPIIVEHPLSGLPQIILNGKEDDSHRTLDECDEHDWSA